MVRFDRNTDKPLSNVFIMKNSELIDLLFRGFKLFLPVK